ncbi:MAG: ABC-2 family transporter protein [Clostridium sp.]|nr:ABC-2 family transporter protein [Clostridium sp.]MCM1399119.1 ABC-2 family transporter protein [Clostridium sp.]MCM1459511.1 ABC-2 family transporter protein [Bacteroides sp.]
MTGGNMNTYGYVCKMQILRSMTYKFNVYGNILMQTILMLTTSFFWKALYQNAETVQGVEVDSMLTYTIISSCISVVLTTNVERRITKSVEKGTIAVDLMRPVNLFAVFFAEDIGNVVALFFQNLLPIIFIGCIFIQVPLPASGFSLFMFFVSLLIAFFINWLIAAMFGMWSFTAINMDALIQVKRHVLRLLSGSMIPLWFFPAWLRTILELFPFAYLYQLPLSIYIGKYDEHSLVRGIGIQLIWLIALSVLFYVLQKRVTKRVMIQGG